MYEPYGPWLPHTMAYPGILHRAAIIGPLVRTLDVLSAFIVACMNTRFIPIERYTNGDSISCSILRIAHLRGLQSKYIPVRYRLYPRVYVR